MINTNHKSKQLQQKFITQQINKANAYSFFNKERGQVPLYIKNRLFSNHAPKHLRVLQPRQGGNLGLLIMTGVYLNPP